MNNKRVKELVERVRLSDEDWESINKKCGFDVMDIIINLDNRYTGGEQMEMIVKRCGKVAQAQLNKVLNDPDLALIDRDAIRECADEDGVMQKYRDTRYILLAEELRKDEHYMVR